MESFFFQICTVVNEINVFKLFLYRSDSYQTLSSIIKIGLFKIHRRKLLCFYFSKFRKKNKEEYEKKNKKKTTTTTTTTKKQTKKKQYIMWDSNLYLKDNTFSIQRLRPFGHAVISQIIMLLYSTCSKKNLYLANPAKGNFDSC